MKWYVVATDYEDDAWVLEFVREFMSAEGLKNHYVGGSLTIEEFELALDIHMGLSPAPRERASRGAAALWDNSIIQDRAALKSVYSECTANALTA